MSINDVGDPGDFRRLETVETSYSVAKKASSRARGEGPTPTERIMEMPFGAGTSETLHPIAEAYREVRRSGAKDLPARNAALELYLRINPGDDTVTADKEVARIISEASRFTPDLLWDGIGSRVGKDPARAAGDIPFTPEFVRRQRGG